MTSWRGGRIGLAAAWLGLAAIGCFDPSHARAAEQPATSKETVLTVAVHVHSDISTGSQSLDQIAEEARRVGIDAVVFSENLALRYEYGLFPLRGMVRRTVTLPSVVEYGFDRYLTAVAEAQARHPDVLLVPGVEVTPHYYWTGSLFDGNLTMHNGQKNLLVFGLTRAEDFAALPVPGNRGYSRYGWWTLGVVWPAGLLLYALWLWPRKWVREIRVGMTTMRVVKHARVPAGLLAAGSTMLLLLAWPFDAPRFSFYDDRLGERPYQALIDETVKRGGVAVWSMPEAKDFNVHPYGPLGTVTVKTDPYPVALLGTSGYTGFGGVYQEGRKIAEPGGLWDQLLLQYLAGLRADLPISFGEIAFHQPGQSGMELNQVLNIVTARERTAAGLLEAIKAGRLYALGQAGRPYGLRLDTFRVETQDGTRAAAMGQPFVRAAEPPAVRVAVTATDRGRHQVRVTVVRSGQVIASLSGATPFQQRVVDQSLPAGSAAYYRVGVQGEGVKELLSNPIFVKGS